MSVAVASLLVTMLSLASDNKFWPFGRNPIIATILGSILVIVALIGHFRWNKGGRPITAAAFTLVAIFGSGIIVGTWASSPSGSRDPVTPEEKSSLSTTTTTSTSVGKSSNSNPTTSSASSTLPVGAEWRGPLFLRDNGVDVDSAPPKLTAGNGLDISQAEGVIRVVSYHGLKIVSDPDAQPSRDGCRAALATVADKVANEILTPTVPGKYCFSTTGGRVVSMELQEKIQGGYKAEITLWTK